MKQRFGLIGAPTSLGASIRGAELAPAALRPGLDMGRVEDYGDVVVRTCPVGDYKKRRFSCIKKNNDALSRKVKKVLEEGRTPLVLGGDHSVSIGSIMGVAAHYGHIGLIYIDAHGDYNTAKTSPSGNVHGMVVSEVSRSEHCALSCKDALIAEQHIVLIGVRDLDAKEKDRLLASRITVFTIDMVRELGVGVVMKKAMRIVSAGTKGYYCSLDIDALNPRIAPATGYRVKNGLRKDEIMDIMKYVAHGKLLGFDLVEVNPKKDVRKKTVKLASALLKKITT